MNKSIFIGVIAVIAVLMVASTVLTSDVFSTRNKWLDRANNNLDEHIDAGGAHGEAAQRYKDKINEGSDDSCPGCG